MKSTCLRFYFLPCAHFASAHSISQTRVQRTSFRLTLFLNRMQMPADGIHGNNSITRVTMIPCALNNWLAIVGKRKETSRDETRTRRTRYGVELSSRLRRLCQMEANNAFPKKGDGSSTVEYKYNKRKVIKSRKNHMTMTNERMKLYNKTYNKPLKDEFARVARII
jgi:hypothetical protein